jgi:hypothetical protein
MKTFLSALCLLPMLSMQAGAADFISEPTATAYWQIPLAVSKTGHEQQAFGFRMDQAVRDNTGNLVSSFSNWTHAPVVDFRFNANGMQGIYVRGVNMATPAVMKNGIEETVLWIVGGVALGAAALIIEANDHGSSSCKTLSVASDVGFGMPVFGQGLAQTCPSDPT